MYIITGQDLWFVPQFPSAFRKLLRYWSKLLSLKWKVLQKQLLFWTGNVAWAEEEKCLECLIVAWKTANSISILVLCFPTISLPEEGQSLKTASLYMSGLCMTAWMELWAAWSSVPGHGRGVKQDDEMIFKVPSSSIRSLILCSHEPVSVLLIVWSQTLGHSAPWLWLWPPSARCRCQGVVQMSGCWGGVFLPIPPLCLPSLTPALHPPSPRSSACCPPLLQNPLGKLLSTSPSLSPWPHPPTKTHRHTRSYLFHCMHRGNVGLKKIRPAPQQMEDWYKTVPVKWSPPPVTLSHSSPITEQQRVGEGGEKWPIFQLVRWLALKEKKKKKGICCTKICLEVVQAPAAI